MSVPRFLENLRQDFAYAGRSFRRNPGFTATAILTLALGLGANAAIFSFVDAVLLKPLPYPEPDRLIMVFEKPPEGFRNAVSALNFLDWRESSKSADLTASGGTWLTMAGRGEPQKVQARVVSYDYFGVLGCQAATGRTFLPEEGAPGNEKVLLLSHRYWTERLGGDPGILGKSLTLDGSPYKVVGTLPAGSWFDRHPANVWMPLAITPTNSSRDFHYLQVYGRLRPGATPPGMVRVPGGTVSIPGLDAAKLNAFLMDRYEITNRQFKQFIDRGGYQKPKYWKQSFVRGGRGLSREEAMHLFLDSTGRPGPSTWEFGEYPEGHDEYPVNGVSWYEAAAYAEFAGKQLPTIYHWQKAASPGFFVDIAELSNVGGAGPARVGAYKGLGTRLLGAPEKDKRLVLWNGGHALPSGQRIINVKETLDWYDRYLGPVK